MKYVCSFAVSLLLFLSPIYAGTTKGTIAEVYIHGYNDKVLFKMTASTNNIHDCATTKRYAVSTGSQQGKNILTSVITAKLSGKTVTVVGLNTCDTHSDAEDINYLVIH